MPPNFSRGLMHLQETSSHAYLSVMREDGGFELREFGPVPDKNVDRYAFFPGPVSEPLVEDVARALVEKADAFVIAFEDEIAGRGLMWAAVASEPSGDMPKELELKRYFGDPQEYNYHDVILELLGHLDRLFKRRDLVVIVDAWIPTEKLAAEAIKDLTNSQPAARASGDLRLAA